MTKRYKILEGALDYLGQGTTAVNLPDDNPLKKFKEIRSKERRATYTRREESKPGELNEVIVHPFSKAFNTNTGLIVPISARVQNETTMNPFLTAANVDAGDTTPAIRAESYLPAKCTVSVRNTQLDEETETSQITGIEYKKIGFESYTFPYGKSATEDYEETVRAGIREAIPSTGNYNLQFSSEKF